jgi:hypothetical protein
MSITLSNKKNVSALLPIEKNDVGEKNGLGIE